MDDVKKLTVDEMAKQLKKSSETIRRYYRDKGEYCIDGYKASKVGGKDIIFAPIDRQDNTAQNSKVAVSQVVQDAKDRRDIAEAQMNETKSLRDAELYKRQINDITEWDGKIAKINSENAQRDDALKTAELKLANDRIMIDAEKLELENNTELVRDLQKAISDIMIAYDADIIARENDVIKLNRELNNTRSELDTLKQLANEHYNDVILPIIEKVNNAIKQANKIATQAYYTAERSKGKTADWYNNKANNYWSIIYKLKEYVNAIMR